MSSNAQHTPRFDFREIGARLRRLLKSRQLWGYVAAVAVAAIVAMAFFYPDASLGNELRQHDMLQGEANGHETQVYAQANGGDEPRWTNALFSGMPTFQISPSYPSDSLFRWITTVYGGFLPSPANLVFMMMLGFLIMMAAMRMRWYYALLGALAWGFSTYFIIIIGAGHIWKFVTLAYIPPTIGGIVLAYKGRRLAGAALAALFAMMQIQSNHVQMSYYFLMVIAALAVGFLCSAIQKKETGAWLKSTGALLVAACLAVAANLPSLYNTYEYSKYTMRGGHSELSSGKSDASTTRGLDRDYITHYSYGTVESLSLLIPNIKGGSSAVAAGGRLIPTTVASLPEAPDAMRSAGLNEAEAGYIKSYVGQYFGDPEGTNGPVYVGAIVFVLFLLGCFIVKGPVKWSLLVMTLLSVALAWGRHFQGLTDFFIDYVPMYSKFRTVESILVVAEFCMPLLAVMALHRLLTTPNALQRYRWPLAVAFGVPALVCFIGWVAPATFGPAIGEGDEQISQMIAYQLQMQGYPADVARIFSIDNPRIAAVVSDLRLSLLSADAMRSLLFIALAALVLLAASKGWLKSRPVAVCVLAALVLADLYTVNKRYINSESFVAPRPATAQPFPLTDTDRAILADTTMHYRVMDIPNFTRPDASYHHKTIGGYHAAKLTRYQDLIDRHLGHFISGEATEADMRVLDMLNARYIIGPDGNLMFNDRALGNAWIIDTLMVVDTPDAEMAALSRIDPATTAVINARYTDALVPGAALGSTAVQPSAPADTIYLTSYAPDRLEYAFHTDQAAWAVFSEVYFPWGWKATVDGGEQLPIVPVDYLLRAVRLPAGSHSLVMEFRPESVRNTVAVARVAVMAIYLMVLAAIAAALLRKPSDNE